MGLRGALGPQYPAIVADAPGGSERFKRMAIPRLTLVLGLAVLLGSLPLVSTKALEIRATPVPHSGPIGVLAEVTIPELPTPHAEVWFLRWVLAPAGSMPAEMQIGPTVIYVEQGSLTLITDRVVSVAASGEMASPTAAQSSPAATEFETTLRPRDSVLITDGTTLAARNDSDEPVTFLALLMFSAVRETTAGTIAAEPVGLSQQGISAAPAEFPGRPGTVTMERILLDSGGTLESDSGNGMGVGGLDLGAIEGGSADATFSVGSSWLWPNILEEFDDRQPIDPGATLQLTAGDGYSTYDGLSSWTVTSEDPLVLLRVLITPGA